MTRPIEHQIRDLALRAEALATALDRAADKDPKTAASGDDARAGALQACHTLAAELTRDIRRIRRPGEDITDIPGPDERLVRIAERRCTYRGCEKQARPTWTTCTQHTSGGRRLRQGERAEARSLIVNLGEQS